MGKLEIDRAIIMDLSLCNSSLSTFRSTLLSHPHAVLGLEVSHMHECMVIRLNIWSVF